jgi:hypothetical protein
MEFFETPAFTRLLPTYLDDDEYRQLQNRLGASPEDGVVIPGTGGFRKMRWTDPGGAKAGEAGCGSFTTISQRSNKFGSLRSMERMKL